MFPYSLSEDARIDIDDIWDYYEQAEGESVAESQYVLLRNIFQLIADNPLVGRS